MTRMTDRRSAALASTALVAGLLAGCTSDTTDPTTSTTASSTTSSTTTTSPSTTSRNETSLPKPELPREATKNNPVGALAFVNYYWEVLNYSMTRPDSRLLEPLALESCNLCAKYAKITKELAGADSRFDRPLANVKETSIIVSSKKATRVQALVTKLPAKRVSSDGTESDEQTAEEAVYIYTVSWTGAEWRVAMIGSVGN